MRKIKLFLLFGLFTFAISCGQQKKYIEYKVEKGETMRTIAKKLDLKNKYICNDLLLWKPKNKVDLVHSMEVFYYLKEPQKLIQHVFSNWLKEGARLIIGLDFYSENISSHSWPEECGISIMSLFSESEWKTFFLEVGFKKISSWHSGVKKNWDGTLIITGIK